VRHRPQGEGLAVQKHGAQHHRRHDEGPLRRHVGAGQEEVEERDRQRHDRRRLLGIQPQRDPRHQRQAIADQREHEPGQEGEVHPRDRQKMREVRIAQVFHCRL
jgi:hypothetical protein